MHIHITYLYLQQYFKNIIKFNTITDKYSKMTIALERSYMPVDARCTERNNYVL